MSELDTLWDLLNKIDEKLFKLEGVAAIIDIVAEGISDNHASSALWLCGDVIREKSEEISLLVGKCMSANRLRQDEYNELIKKLIKQKGKK